MLKHHKNSLVLFLLACLFGNSKAQFYRFKNSGLSVGAAISVGNKTQRIGLTLNAYYFNNFIQFNGGIRFYRNLKNLGPNLEYNETVLSGGVVIAYGAKQNHFNQFVTNYSNQTKRKYSIAYTYNAYINKIGTSQQTGIVAFQFNTISLITENDILARPQLDRFRTGAFLLQYQYQNIAQVAINCTMWTGQMGSPVRNDTTYPYTGYMNTDGGIYTNYSHGLLSAQAKFNLGYGQLVQSNIGIDAEQVRNMVQNRIIHDAILLPKKQNKKNCHIPMIDSQGESYLYRPTQKIKPAEFYWNFASNASAFY